MSLLGGFAAAVDGMPVPETAWRLKKARELVKLLALAPGHRLHREQVMDVLWRERNPEAAANNLNQAVHVARRALDACAITVRDGVIVLSADVDVDALELAAAEARHMGTPSAYRAALRLYGGELLPENRYDDWAEERRAELADLAAELADGAAPRSADCGLGAGTSGAGTAAPPTGTTRPEVPLGSPDTDTQGTTATGGRLASACGAPNPWAAGACADAGGSDRLAKTLTCDPAATEPACVASTSSCPGRRGSVSVERWE